MSDPRIHVRISNVHIDQIDVGSVDDESPRYVPGRFQLEVVVHAADVTLEEAQQYVSRQTVFRLEEL